MSKIPLEKELSLLLRSKPVNVIISKPKSLAVKLALIIFWLLPDHEIKITSESLV